MHIVSSRISSQRALLCKAILGGQWINDVAKRAVALSCQQRVMADLQLALNHCLTAGAASATTAATDTNLWLWPELQLHIRQRRCEAYQSINHSFTTSLTNSSHCQTKWFLVLLDAVCIHNLFAHGCGLEIYFFTKRFMWVHTCHHCSFALCCLFSYSSGCFP